MGNDMALLGRPLTLPNGTVVANRLFKSAMSEGLATWDNRVTPQLVTLYSRWARSGAGVLVTGNVMIDGSALGEPGNVVIEDESDLFKLTEWAAAGTQNNTQLWVQLNHPGKQAPRGLNKETVAPSAVPFDKALRGAFATPRELTEAEIQALIGRFGRAASIAKAAGFTGVQIHGAHGYLVSQFLSGHHNQRTDQWGGNAANRRRFVLAVYHEIRRQVGANFPVSIKLNSADFQRGGFTQEESLAVVRALSEAGIDLIEISGGNYESPVMTGQTDKSKTSTREREAYFLAFAEKARAATLAPLVVTGGFRTPGGMAAALASNAVDMVGLARLLAIEPEAPKRLLAGQQPLFMVRPIRTGISFVDKAAMMEVLWYGRQLRRLGNGCAPKPRESGLKSLFASLLESGWGTFRTRLRA